MSAVIETLVDQQIRDRFWIEKNVVRLGRGADCDVAVDQPGIPSHLATVRFRNGQYAIYNRSGRRMSVADREIGAEGSGDWFAGELLQITPEIALRLLIDGSPAPSCQPDNEMLESYQQKRAEELRVKSVQQQQEVEAAEQTEAPVSGRSSNLFPLLVAILLGLLLIGMASVFGFLVLRNAMPAKPSFQPQAVAKSLLARSSELPPQLVQLLQEAQQSVELLDRDLGKERLLRLQSELQRLKADGADLTVSQGSQRVSYEDALRSYINLYLSQLE